MKWFIADLHLDHDKVLIGKRGEAFPNIEEWQIAILDAINKCACKKDDKIYLLGDMAFKDIGKWSNKIRCKQKTLIKGNHDPSNAKCIAVFGKDNVRDAMDIKVCGHRCFLSHYAHAFWPASHHGAMHLYGHNHGQREDTLNSWMPQRRSMDVCPEIIFQITGEWRPINEEEIYNYLIKFEGHDPVSFYQKLRGEYV